MTDLRAALENAVAALASIREANDIGNAEGHRADDWTYSVALAAEELARVALEANAKANPIDEIAKAVSFHHFGIDWKHTEQASKDDLTAIVRTMLDAAKSEASLSYGDAIETITLRLAFLCDEAALDPNDKVILNRAKLRNVATEAMRAAMGFAETEVATRLESKASRAIINTDETIDAVARAIWNIRRVDEDRCDIEFEEVGQKHSVWAEARAAVEAVSRSTGGF